MFNLLGDTLTSFDMLENNDSNYEFLYEHQSPEELNVQYSNMTQYAQANSQSSVYPDDYDANQYQYTQSNPFQTPALSHSMGTIQSAPAISSSHQSPTQNVYQYYSQPVLYQPPVPMINQYAQGANTQVQTPVSATAATHYPYYGSYLDGNAGNSYQNSPYQDAHYSQSANVSKDFSPLVKAESSPPQAKANNSSKKDFDNKVIMGISAKRYRAVRGIASGGCSARPPKQPANSNIIFLPIELNIIGGGLEEICFPKWSRSEKEDKRRIVRIERLQKGPKLYINFSIIGSANENPTPLPPPPDMDVIEVSCLECSTKLNDEINESSEDDHSNLKMADCDYYITSVEVIEIVELLIGTLSDDPAERRKERGRVRSNLVPFWGKKPISSRVDNASPTDSSPDYRIELAKRIMSYEIRKPRGFDKEVRILRWEKLIPALKRALQSYYCEIPKDFSLDF